MCLQIDRLEDLCPLLFSGHCPSLHCRLIIYLLPPLFLGFLKSPFVLSCVSCVSCASRADSFIISWHSLACTPSALSKKTNRDKKQLKNKRGARARRMSRQNEKERRKKERKKKESELCALCPFVLLIERALTDCCKSQEWHFLF